MIASFCKKPVTYLLPILSYLLYDTQLTFMKHAPHIYGSYFVEIIPQKTQNISYFIYGSYFPIWIFANIHRLQL